MKRAIFILWLIPAIVVFFVAAMVMAGGAGITEFKIYTDENPPRFYGSTPVGPNQAANYLGTKPGLPHVNGLVVRIGMNADVVAGDSCQLWATNAAAAAGPYGIKYHFVGTPNPRTWFDIQRDDTPGYTQYLDATKTERVTFWIKAAAGTKYPLWLRVRCINSPVDGKDVEGASIMIDGETVVKKDVFGNYYAFQDSAFNGQWQFVSIPWGFLNLDSAGVSVIPYSLADSGIAKAGRHLGAGKFDLKTIKTFTLDTREGGSQAGYPWPTGTGTADYWLDEVVFTLEEGTGILGVDGTPTQMPLLYELGNAYPNPFNPSTTIDYAVPVSNHVTLKIYDLLGRTVRTLVDRYTTPGTYKVVWDARNDAGNPVPSGVYLYRMESSHFAQVKRLVLLK